MNKRVLYEQIMSDVAKVVKKHLNESESFHTKYRKMYGAIEYLFEGDDEFPGILGDCKISNEA